MTEFETKRDPRIPPMPNKTDWQKFERIEQWRRSNLTIIRQLHADTYNDLHTLANETANNANDITDLEANQHAAVTVGDTSTINLTLSGQRITGVVANQASHLTIFPWEMTTHGGTWVANVSSSQYLNTLWHNSSNYGGDQMLTPSIQMEGGNYRWTILTRTGPDRGIAQLIRGSTPIASVDLYAEDYTYNVALSNVAAISTGSSAIGLRAAYTSNTSSTGYFISFSYLNLQRYS